MVKRSSTAFAVAVALLTSTGDICAQGGRVGAKIGIDLANLGADAEELYGASLKSRTGFSIGGFASIELHRLFRLQFDGQYVQKGAKFDADGVDVTTKLDYLEFLVPVTLLIPTEGGAATPRVYVGPALGIELSCKFSGEESGLTVDLDCDDPDLGVETKSIDFGIFVGAGVDIAIGGGAITFDALYNFGLANINDIFDASALEVTNRNLQLLVGFAFSIGR